MVDPDWSQDLSQGAKGAVEREGERLFVGGGEKEATVQLAAIDLEPDRRYLLVVSAGRGRAITLAGVERLNGDRLYMRFPARGAAQEYLRVLDYGPRAARLRLKLVVPGPERQEVVNLALHRLSATRESARWLPPLLAALALTAFMWRHGARLGSALSRPSPLEDLFFAAAVFALCLLAFQKAPVQQMMDGRGVTMVSYSLLHGGGLAIPEDAVSRRSSGQLPYWALQVDGSLYHYAYTPVGVLNTPFVWAFERFGVSAMTAEGARDSALEIGVLRTISAVLAAALCSILYCFGRLRLVPWLALALTGAFAFGTQIFSTVSRPYWSHAWALVLMAAGLYLVVSPRFRRSGASLVLAATLLALACACRPIMLVSAAAAAVLLWRDAPARHRTFFLATGAAWGLLIALGSRHLLGTIFPTHMLYVLRRWKGVETLSDYSTGVLGTLVSPARGLLFYVPLLAWILWMAFRLRRQVPSRYLMVTAAGAIVLHWQLLIASGVWADGQAFGARLFSDVLVWFFILAVLVLEAWRKGSWNWSPATTSALLVALATSLFVNARGATEKATWHWDWIERPPAWLLERREPVLYPPQVWNWRYPQFMAGLLSREGDGRELRAKYGLRWMR